jgi:hypothetical protein
LSTPGWWLISSGKKVLSRPSLTAQKKGDPSGPLFFCGVQLITPPPAHERELIPFHGAAAPLRGADVHRVWGLVPQSFSSSRARHAPVSQASSSRLRREIDGPTQACPRRLNPENHFATSPFTFIELLSAPQALRGRGPFCRDLRGEGGWARSHPKSRNHRWAYAQRYAPLPKWGWQPEGRRGPRRIGWVWMGSGLATFSKRPLPLRIFLRALRTKQIGLSNAPF